MAYVTSTNLCYHDIMHVECSLFVDRFRWHLQYRLFQSPKYSTDYHLFLAAEKIAEIPARGRGWMRYIRLQKIGASLWDGVQMPPPPQ